jgi:hypothetical protein
VIPNVADEEASRSQFPDSNAVLLPGGGGLHRTPHNRDQVVTLSVLGREDLNPARQVV